MILDWAHFTPWTSLAGGLIIPPQRWQYSPVRAPSRSSFCNNTFVR